MKNDTEKLMAFAANFHGHRCGGLAIGVKACEALAEKWGLRIGGGCPNDTQAEKIVCVAENNSCSVDALQSLLGCTVGSGTLFFLDYGKQAFSFFDRAGGRSLRLSLSADLSVVPKVDREAFILSGHPSDLFEFSDPPFGVPERAAIFDSEICALCGERVAKHRAVFAEGMTLCRFCFGNGAVPGSF